MRSKLLAALVSVLGFLAVFFKIKSDSQKIDKIEEDNERLKSVEKSKADATEAMLRGLENEHNHDSYDVNNRNYDFNNDR